MIAPPSIRRRSEWQWLRHTLLVLGLSSPLLAQHPIIPGVDRLRGHESSTAAERGTVLLGELSCIACHAAAEQLIPRRAPDLSAIGARVTVNWLRRFLLAPHSSKPGSLMPSWRPSADTASRSADVELLLHYLISQGGPLEASTRVASESQVATGRKLFHSIGCVGCHAPEDQRKTGLASVPLGQLAHKMTLETLSAFLLDPQSIRPAGRMPKFWLSQEEADALAMYLLRDQIANPLADNAVPPAQPGLAYDFYAIESAAIPDFADRRPEFQSVVMTVTHHDADMPADQRYALRLHGKLEVPEHGAFTFFLNSRGESRLLIDGELVIADGTDQRSGLAELPKGRHDIEIEYSHFKGKQRLALQWSGPGYGKRKIRTSALHNHRGRAMIPLQSHTTAVYGRDPTEIQRGRQRFVELGCTACHEPTAAKHPATPMAELDPNRPGSCLDHIPAGGAVAYQLSATQDAEIRAALSQRAWSRNPDNESRVRRQLAAFNCYACHARDSIGGPTEARDQLFTTKISIDLGDEGRHPPTLTGVGDKLQPTILAEVIKLGEHHIRGAFMSTRMPGFRSPQIDSLVEQLIAADRQPSRRTPTPFSLEAVAAGKRLVGINGFACVTCHNVNGGLSAAIPGVDLATAGVRLNQDWFHRYLQHPPTFRPGTRMPAFWTEAKSPFADLLGGSSQQQMDAVWSYLSLGKSIPAPDGSQRDDGRPKMELIPSTEPILHRTFMKDVSQRAILVGYPENLHVAFDAQSVRLAKAWRGRFFDASGVASGRTDRFYGPLGDQELILPAPAFATLANRQSDWPVIARGQRDVGGTFLGYRFAAARRPVFRYSYAGFEIQEQPIPILEPGGAVLERRFRLLPGDSPDNLYFLVWRGDSIEKIEKIKTHRYRSGDVTIDLSIDIDHDIIIRPAGKQQELLIYFALAGRQTPVSFQEILRW